MKNNLSKYMMMGLTTINLLALPTATFAQDTMTQPNNGLQLQPQTGNLTAPGTTTTEDDGFNPWWLLPIVLIPLALMFFKRNDDKEDNRNTTRGEYEQMAYHDIEKNKSGKKTDNTEEDEDRN